MPKLNRIRIANVYYDGNYIMDQTFDTFGGENTLLNLANGGGKSVLVQMMMQPIIPCKRIHDRRVDYYVSKTNSPTYIMLEWKLDYTQTPIYFLTGIAMCSIGQGDESDSRVKYFTFTYKYESAAPYDISAMPLIQKADGGYKYMPYDDALKLLKNVRDELRPLRCYTRDRSEAYRKDLADHGIFAKEWELLAHVNNKEGGVDEMFADCKSSDTLLNKWILRTIADKTGEDEQNLREMFIALISSILDQEEAISEKELLAELIAEVDRLLAALSELCTGLDELAQTRLLLSGLYAYLNNRVKEIELEKTECTRVEQQQREAEKHIRHERLSEEWHNTRSEYVRLKELLFELQADTEEKRAVFERAKLERETMEAAGYKKAIQEANTEINVLTDRLDKLRTLSEDMETRDVLYTLDRIYAAELKRNGEREQSLDNRIAELDREISEAENEKRRLDDTVKRVAGELGELKQKLNMFEGYEKDCFKKLGITVRRLLTRELCADEAADERKKLEAGRERLNRRNGELAVILNTHAAKRQELDSEQKRLHDEMLSFEIQVRQKKDEIKAYEKTIETLVKIAELRDIPANAGNVAESLNKLKEQAIQYKSEISSFEAQLTRQSDTLSRLRANSLHNAPAFGELLTAHNIPYTTGENYLKEQNADGQRKLLALNPMLPFSFLVGKSDFERAASLPYEDGIDRLCPILALEDVEINTAVGVQSTAQSDAYRIMCYYFEKSFNPDTKDAFASMLEDAVVQIARQRDMWQEDYNRLQNDISFMEAFPYNSDSGRAFTDEHKRLESLLSETNKTIEQNISQQNDLRELYERTQDEIPENNRKLKQTSDNITLLEDYLVKNDEYIVNFEKKLRLESELTKTEKCIKEYETRRESRYEEKTAARREKDKIEQTINDLSKKHAGIGPAKEGVMLDWTLSALEERFDEILRKQSSDEASLNGRIASWNREKSKADKELRKYRHIPDSDVQVDSYDETQLEYLQQEERLSASRLKDSENEFNDVRAKHAAAEATHTASHKRLEDDGWPEPLPPEEIKGDYQARLALVRKELDIIREKREALNKENDTCQRNSHRILSIIEKPEYISIEPPKGGWSGVDIDEQSARYRRKSDLTAQCRDQSKGMVLEMKRKFGGKHTGADNLLESLSVDKCELTYEAYYYIYERLTEQRNLLSESVRILTTFLSRLEGQKANVVYHAFAQGKRLHTELKKISESSRVRLSPDRPRQQTLKIDILDELDALAEERIGVHVESCILELRRLKKEGALDAKTVRGIVESKLSNRELLNQIIGQTTITVRLLKIDANQSNTKLRRWESVLTDNSGGEMFVSCFVLLSALMDYMRMNQAIGDGSGGVKLMLIDNPFGKTSSHHLLDALIQVARQFNMQMICLSDLSQSSITGKFAVIYQLSVRPALYSNKSYLKADAILQNEPVQKDSRLEHATLRHEQLSLF